MDENCFDNRFQKPLGQIQILHIRIIEISSLYCDYGKRE